MPQLSQSSSGAGPAVATRTPAAPPSPARAVRTRCVTRASSRGRRGRRQARRRAPAGASHCWSAAIRSRSRALSVQTGCQLQRADPAFFRAKSSGWGRMVTGAGPFGLPHSRGSTCPTSHHGSQRPRSPASPSKRSGLTSGPRRRRSQAGSRGRCRARNADASPLLGAPASAAASKAFSTASSTCVTSVSS